MQQFQRIIRDALSCIADNLLLDKQARCMNRMHIVKIDIEARCYTDRKPGKIDACHTRSCALSDLKNTTRCQNLDRTTNSLTTDGKCRRQLSFPRELITDTQQSRSNKGADLVCDHIANGAPLKVAPEPCTLIE
ncbi:hypothetical protein D3C80_1526870 [compost metagenome]